MKLWEHWKCIRTFHFTINMRVVLRRRDCGSADLDKIQKFSDFLLRVGDGANPALPTSDGNAVPIEDRMMSKSSIASDFIDEFYSDISSLTDEADYFNGRAILTPKNSTVHDINAIVIQKLPGIFCDSLQCTHRFTYLFCFTL